MTDPRSPRARRPGGRKPPPARPAADAARVGGLRGAPAVSERGRLRQPPAPGADQGRTGSTPATPPSPPSWWPGSLRRQGTYDAIIAACANRPLEPHRRRRARRAAAGHAPAARHAGRRPRRGRHLGRPGPGRGGPERHRLRQRGAAPGGRALASTPGCARSRPTRPTDPIGFAVGRAAPTPAGWSRSSQRRAGRPRRRARRPAGRRQPAAAGHAGRPARAGRARDELLAAGGEPTRLLAVRRGAGRRRPGCGPGGRRRAGRGAGRGLPAGRRSRSPRRRVEGRDDALAGPLRRARAARPPCWARVAAGRGAPGCSPVERQPHRADLVRRAARGPAGRARSTVLTGDGTAPAWDPGTLRPGARRRSVHRPGRAAAPARSRAGGARPATSRRWCRCRSRLLELRRWTPCGPGAWSSTRPAHRCSPRPPAWSATCSTAGTDVDARGRRDALLDRCRTRPGRCPARCSCGRTGTAPTRCSWRCCAGADAGRRDVVDVRHQVPGLLRRACSGSGPGARRPWSRGGPGASVASVVGAVVLAGGRRRVEPVRLADPVLVRRPLDSAPCWPAGAPRPARPRAVPARPAPRPPWPRPASA